MAYSNDEWNRMMAAQNQAAMTQSVGGVFGANPYSSLSRRAEEAIKQQAIFEARQREQELLLLLTDGE